MKYAEFTNLPDTYKDVPLETPTNIADPTDVITTTITLRWQRSIDEALMNGVRLTREEFDIQFGISGNRFAIVKEFASFFGLDIENTNVAGRSIALKGKICDFERAFNVSLYNYSDKRGIVFRGRHGYISVPKELIEVIEGVFGLDDRPNSAPLLSNLNHAATSYKSHKGYTPLEVAEAYGFPNEVDGKGQCIAIIELGGGYRQIDIDKYFAGLKSPVPDISWVGVDGAFNAPTIAESYDKEVMMNVEVAGAIAPGAKIVVYFAPNTDKGFFNAITTAIHDKKNRPSVISISWGGPEKNFTNQSLSTYNDAFKVAAILGITVCVATGNLGVRNGVKDGRYHVDFPASSPFVLSCGGTQLLIKSNTIVSETAWHESDTIGGGGGVSDFFSLPDYQANSKVPLSKNQPSFKGRGLPDVAGNANPLTGYKILVHDIYMLIGGTSAVAPLYAGLIALINEQKGVAVGFINPHLYSNSNLCRNISLGNTVNGFNPVFKPSLGWDACTGLGVLSKI